MNKVVRAIRKVFGLKVPVDTASGALRLAYAQVQRMDQGFTCLILSVMYHANEITRDAADRAKAKIKADIGADVTFEGVLFARDKQLVERFSGIQGVEAAQQARSYIKEQRLAWINEMIEWHKVRRDRSPAHRERGTAGGAARFVRRLPAPAWMFPSTQIKRTQ